MKTLLSKKMVAEIHGDLLVSGISVKKSHIHLLSKLVKCDAPFNRIACIGNKNILSMPDYGEKQLKPLAKAGLLYTENVAISEYPEDGVYPEFYLTTFGKEVIKIIKSGK